MVTVAWISTKELAELLSKSVRGAKWFAQTRKITTRRNPLNWKELQYDKEQVLSIIRGEQEVCTNHVY